MLPMFCALLVLGSPALPPPLLLAWGDDAPNGVAQTTRVAISPIVYSEVIPSHTRAAVRATLGEAVKNTAPNALLLDVDAECRTRECALRQARDADAKFLLESSMTFEERDYAIRIVVVDAADGRELAEASDLCHLCAQAELLARIATQVATLHETLGRSRVQVPVGGQLDGSPPLRDGLRPANRPGLQIGGWVSFTLGLAGVGIGATMIAIDGHEHRPSCGAELRDINGACPNVYTTRIAGLIGAGLGGAVLTTGIALLIAGGTRREQATTARIRPAPGGLRIEF